jgi:hypothetical protein
MKVSSNKFRKHIAAVATALAAIVVPVQAADCSTCEESARQAGYTAAKQKENEALAYCTRYYYGMEVNNCMNSKGAEISAAYYAAYNQTYNQCMGSCS